jgi:signal transduction histidine kinase
VRPAERLAQELERFRDITRRLLRGHELADVLDTVSRAAAELTGATSGHVSLLTDDGAALHLAAATGPLAALAGRTLPREGSMAGWVIAAGEPLVANDLACDPRSYAAVNQEFGFTRGIMVPLRSRGAVIGALGADRGAGSRPFDGRDVQALEGLSELAVLAIENARQFESLTAARTALAAKNRALEQATVAKSAFLAAMSHELRTPLNAIIGFTELLTAGTAGPLTTEQRDFLDTVVRNSRHLLGLINDLLDLAKVEAGRMDLALTRVDVRLLVAEVFRDLEGLLQRRRLHIVQELSSDPLVVTADEVRVRQVLFNLLSNAVKYTPDDGEISVRALRTTAPLPVPADRAGDTDRLAPRAAVWLAVGDTGPGIRPEDMGKLFQEFSQVDQSLARKSGGTGLGLALCKRFVEMHGGTIGAESLYGHGCTFWFLLPVDGPVRHHGS